MKTINLKSAVILAVVLIVQFVLDSEAWSQVCKEKSRIDIGIASNLTNTSSGLGLLNETNVFYKCGRSEIKSGMVWQSQYAKISGFTIQYRYYLINNDDLGLFTMLYTMRNYNVNLRNEINQVLHHFNYSELKEFERFNTQEYYLGFGIHFKLFKELFLDSKIGFGAYTSQILNEDLRDKNTTYHSDNGFGLLLSAGLRYQINIPNKKKRWP